MVPVVRIGDVQWERLKRWAVPLEDTPDTALRRALDAAEAHLECLRSHPPVPAPSQQVAPNEASHTSAEREESMLTLVTDQQENSQHQRQLMAALDGTRAGTFECTIAWRPGSIRGVVSWSHHGFWWYSRKTPDEMPNRWWNAFGLEQPTPAAILRITCEINIPFVGPNRQVAGAFLRDDSGRVFLAHRGGPIGGGKRGITKALFWSSYQGTWRMAEDGGPMTRFAVITELGSESVAGDIAGFLHFVSDAKRSV